MKPVGLLTLLLSASAGWIDAAERTRTPPPQESTIYWGDDVPKEWTGQWPEHLLTVPEKTDYARTSSTYEVHEFIDVLKWNSENVHVLVMPSSCRPSR